MKANRFSVIVPVYNTQKFLKTCVDSIMGQTYGSFEVILVDDGSTDESGTICDSYAEMYPSKISVIHKKNEGLISARRAGLKAAKGEYIFFVDSDDYIRKDALEKVHVIIKGSHPDMVVFNWTYVDETGNNDVREVPCMFDEGSVDKEKFFQAVLTLDMNSIWRKVCRYDLFDIEKDYSKWYCISRGEDLLQSIPLIFATKKIYYLAEPLYCYRKNLTSITHVYQKDQYHELDVILPLLYDCMVELGYDTADNILLFYKSYLNILRGNLCVFSRSDAGLEEYKAYFTKLSDFGYVKKAAIYTQKPVFRDMVSFRGRILLKLFYTHRWWMLIGYLKILAVAGYLRDKLKQKV